MRRITTLLVALTLVAASCTSGSAESARPEPVVTSELASTSAPQETTTTTTKTTATTVVPETTTSSIPAGDPVAFSARLLTAEDERFCDSYLSMSASMAGGEVIDVLVDQVIELAPAEIAQEVVNTAALDVEVYETILELGGNTSYEVLSSAVSAAAKEHLNSHINWVEDIAQPIDETSNVLRWIEANCSPTWGEKQILHGTVEPVQNQRKVTSPFPVSLQNVKSICIEGEYLEIFRSLWNNAERVEVLGDETGTYRVTYDWPEVDFDPEQTTTNPSAEQFIGTSCPVDSFPGRQHPPARPEEDFESLDQRSESTFTITID